MNNNWTTFQGNVARTGESKETLIPPLKKVWEYKLKDQVVKSSPIVNNGIVYIGTRTINDWSGAFYALDASSGNLLWKFEPNSEILSTPTVGNGMVYFRTENDVLYALDAISGKKQWEFKHGSVAWPGTSLLLSGNILCMCTDKLYVIDAISGKSIWEEKSERENSGASPALYEGILYYGIEYRFIAYDLNSREQIWEKQTPWSLKPTVGPVIKDNVIYAGSQGHLMAMNVTDGSGLWAIKMPEDPEGHNDTFLKSYPAISQNKLYIGAPNGKVYCLDARTGNGVWGFNVGTYISTSPVVSGNVVYILSSKGAFYALDVNNGQKLWEYKSEIFIHDVRSSAAICNGKLYIGWDKVYAFTT